MLLYQNNKHARCRAGTETLVKTYIYTLYTGKVPKQEGGPVVLSIAWNDGNIRTPFRPPYIWQNCDAIATTAPSVLLFLLCIYSTSHQGTPMPVRGVLEHLYFTSLHP